MFNCLWGGVAVLLVLTAQAPQPARRVAVTIDDGPVVNEMRDLANFQRISTGLIESLKAEAVPATIFVNERQINVPGQRGRQLVWFRYPFLHSGLTEDSHNSLVAFLEQRQYRVAPVTVDYADYAFAGVHRNQLAAGKTDVAAKIKDAYLNQVDVGFEYAEKASVEVFGHEIPQILLIHCNELNSLTLRESIARIRKRGYTFITLDEAMNDPAYERPDTFAGPGGSWLSRTATVTGKKISVTNARVPAWITELQAPASGAPRLSTGGRDPR